MKKKIGFVLFAVEISVRLVLLYQLSQRVLIEQRYNELRYMRNIVIDRSLGLCTSDTEAQFEHPL